MNCNIEDLKLDDYIANKIINNFNFKNINPNHITIVGLFASLLLNLILMEGIPNLKNKYILILLFIIKYFTDILDGNVARKYNKTSKYGNFLDSLADNSFNFIIAYYIAKKLSIEKYLYIFIFIFISLFEYHYQTNITHENIKKGKFKFLVNNSIIIFIFIIYVFNKYITI